MPCIRSTQGRDGTPHYVANTRTSSFVWDGHTQYIEFLADGYGEPDAVTLPAPAPITSHGLLGPFGVLGILTAFERACTNWCATAEDAPHASDVLTPHLTYFDGDRSIGWTGGPGWPARLHNGY